MSREQAAAELRARISKSDPDLLNVIDGLKDAFGARLKYIRLGDYETGDKQHDVEGIVPARYEPPRLSRKGSSLEWLKEQEAAHFAAHAKQAGAGARKSAGRAKRARVG